MATEDIERLKEKLDKDPNSKLFVPLAEEYKKAGMFDEAVDVLTKGLEAQPGYLSARVSLGKIYIERDMLDEARAEFQKVVAVIPDNLYAHKKLAEIYKDLGEKDEAVREIKTVLRLNPADEWAATVLSSIEQETLEISHPVKDEAEAFPPQDQSSEAGEEMGFWNAPPAPAEEIKEEAAANPFGEAESEPWDESPEGGKEIREEPPGSPFGEMDMEHWEAAEQGDEAAEEQEMPPETALSKEDMELWKTHLDSTGETDITREEDVEPIEVEELLSPEDVWREPEASSQVAHAFIKEEAIPSQPVPGEDVDDADKWIAQGKYGQAMNIYRRVLSADPGDRRVLQRVEELRTLLRLLGKDKEELVVKLEHLLEGIKKRRSEFSGTA